MSKDPKDIYPRVAEARGRTLCKRTFADYWNVVIDMWEGAAPRDKWVLNVAYLPDYEWQETEVVEELYRDVLSKQEIDEGKLEIKLRKSWFDKILDNTNLSLRFVSEIAGVETAFKWDMVTIKDDYTFLSNFRPNSTDGWKVGEKIDPAGVQWESFQGKTWFSCNIENGVRHTVLSREFSLALGCKYLFEARYYLPGKRVSESSEDVSVESVVIRAMDGGKGQGVYTRSDLGRPYFLRFGVTGGADITELKIVAGQDIKSGNCRVYFTDFSFYPFNERGAVAWDEGWDKVYPVDGGSPPESPEDD